MKFYKLVKSIDYVTYPSYVELQKINRSLGDSFSSIKSAFWSAFLALALDGTFISQWLVDQICSKSSNSLIVSFSQNPNASKILAVTIALLVFLVICSVRFVMSRWGSNKKTVEARNMIVSTFYRVIIPNLIALKSIVQQHDEAIRRIELRQNEPEVWDKEKRYLLMLQANYEVCELISELNKLCVVEVSKTNIMTNESKNVLDHIGANVYFTVILDVLTIADDITSRIRNCEGKEIESSLKTIRTTVASSKAVTVCEKLKQYELCVEITNLRTKIESSKSKSQMDESSSDNN